MKRTHDLSLILVRIIPDSRDIYQWYDDVYGLGCVRLAQIIVEIAPGTSTNLECMMRFASTEITAEIKDTNTQRVQALMLQYDNMGLQNKSGTVDTFVQVPVRGKKYIYMYSVEDRCWGKRLVCSNGVL